MIFFQDDEEPITCTITYKLKTENAEEAKALCTAVMPMRVAVFEQGEKTKCVFGMFLTIFYFYFLLLIISN